MVRRGEGTLLFEMWISEQWFKRFIEKCGWDSGGGGGGGGVGLAQYNSLGQYCGLLLCFLY